MFPIESGNVEGIVGVAQCVRVSLPAALTIAAVGVFLLYIVGIAAKAIIGEYAKRFWFRKVFKDAVEKAKSAEAAARSEADKERQARLFAEHVCEIQIAKVHALQDEVLQLKRTIEDLKGKH